MPGGSFPRNESHALAPIAGEGSAGFGVQGAKPSTGESGYRMLAAGIDGLLARVEVIDAARRSLDLQYYIFRADASGLLVAAALLRAADRGVRVRIIVDDGETIKGDEKILAMSAHPGIEVRIFNPFRYRGHSRVIRGTEFLFSKSRLDYRMHNKLLVADNSVALIGGRNIGDQYFQIDPDSQFGDDDLVTVGPIVQRLSGVFDEFWNSRQSIPAQAVDHAHTTEDELTKLRAAIDANRQLPGEPVSDYSKRLAAGKPLSGIASNETPLTFSQARLVYDSPDKKAVVAGLTPGNLIFDAVADEAKSVNTEMLMVTPYLVPSADEANVLKDERARGARVRILTNSLATNPDLAAHAGYMHYRPRLLKEGVELYEIRAKLGNAKGSGQSQRISRYGNYALHGKLFVFDRERIFVGSMNYDQRSKRLNTEIGLIIHSAMLSEQAARRFEELTRLDNAYTVELNNDPECKCPLVWKTRESSVEKIYTKEPARSAGQRVRAAVLSWFPIDKEL
jgi:putative cardiolipin synthase